MEMKKWLIVIAGVIVLAGAGFFVYRVQMDKRAEEAAIKKEEDAHKKMLCESVGGMFNADWSECTVITAAQCQQIGGVFEACGSMCRHQNLDEMETEDGEEYVCSTECAEYCQL